MEPEIQQKCQEKPDIQQPEPQLLVIEDLIHKEKPPLYHLSLRAVFHYVNLVLCFIALGSLQSKWMGSDLNRVITIVVIVGCIIYDRIKAVQSIIALNRMLKQLEVPQIGYGIAIPVALIFSENLYFVSTTKNSRNEIAIMKYKDMSSSLLFYFPVTLLTMNLIFDQYLLDKTIPLILILAEISAFTHTIHGMAQFYLHRQIQQKIFLEKDDIQFATLEFDVRTYLSSPYNIQALRLRDEYLQKNDVFFTDPDNKHIGGLKATSCEITQEQKMWVYVYLSIQMYSSMVLRCLSKYHQLGFFNLDNLFMQILLGYAFYFPQILIHFGVNIKASPTVGGKLLSMAKNIIGAPLAALSGLFHVLLPVNSNIKIPVLIRVQETWAENFLPCCYVYFIQLGIMLLEKIGLDSAIFSGKVADGIDSVQSYNLQTSHFIQKVAQSATFGLYFMLVMSIVYFFEFLNHSYIDGANEEAEGESLGTSSLVESQGFSDIFGRSQTLTMGGSDFQESPVASPAQSPKPLLGDNKKNNQGLKMEENVNDIKLDQSFGEVKKQ